MSAYTFLSSFFAHREIAIYTCDIVYQYQQHVFTSDAEFLSNCKIQSLGTHCALLLRIMTFNKIDRLSDSINKTMESYPDSKIIVGGDFNNHTTNWFHHFSHTSREVDMLSFLRKH